MKTIEKALQIGAVIGVAIFVWLWIVPDQLVIRVVAGLVLGLMSVVAVKHWGSIKKQ